MIKFLQRLLVLVIVIYALLVVALFFGQESILFQATTLPDEYQFEFDQKFEEINVIAKDGAILNALHFKHENPKGVILYFHGNAGDLSRWGNVVQPFIEYQYDVLIMDYRGYGKSTGDRSSEKMYEDADLFYDYLRKKFKEREIIVYGRSLGCTFAAWVASKHKPRELILETPFNSLKSVVDSNYFFLPTTILLKFRFPTNEFIQGVDCHTTFFHGTEDKVVPYENGKALFEITNNSEWIEIDGGAHNNLNNSEKYWIYLVQILEKG